METFPFELMMILCFIVGSGLIIAEAFIPGFGVAGISGIILEIAAIWATWKLFGIGGALIALAGVLLLIGTAVFLSYRSAMKGRLSKSSLILKNREETVEKDSGDQWLGCEGVTVTALRPAGKIEAGDRRLNAASSGDYIEKGTPVIITGKAGDHYVVRRKEEAANG